MMQGTLDMLELEQLYTPAEKEAIFALGKHLWESAWKLYDRDGREHKPTPLMELAHELGSIAYHDYIIHREL